MLSREKTCCFTGHRPEKLPWRKDEQDPRCCLLKERIRDAVLSAYENGMRHFICGMARGCDLYFAEIVVELRRERPDITLEAAIPWPGQCDGWEQSSRERWQKLLAACDMETMIQRSYDPGCMLRRNRYMVDHSSLVIAVYDGTNGGTRRTLEYAIRQRVPFVDIHPELLCR